MGVNFYPMNTLGSRIKQARGRLSQDAFSKLLQISKGSLGFYERDENLPNTDVVLKICSTTGVSLEWLLTGHGPMVSGQKLFEDPAATIAVNQGVLAEIIETLEEFLEEEKKKLPPKVKAKVILILYEMLLKEETEENSAVQRPFLMYKVIKGALAQSG